MNLALWHTPRLFLMQHAITGVLLVCLLPMTQDDCKKCWLVSIAICLLNFIPLPTLVYQATGNAEVEDTRHATPQYQFVYHAWMAYLTIFCVCSVNVKIKV